MSETSFDLPTMIEALKNGDQDAFADFMDKTSPLIYNLGLRMLQNVQDAEDVLQETYLKAFKALPGFEGRSSLVTWLYRIAMNEALMMIRKSKVMGASAELAIDDEDARDVPVEIADWCCLPERDFQTKETKEQLQTAIGQLSLGLRSVFVLRDIQGLSIKETAEILETSESVVKVRLLRARLKLREALSVYFKEHLEGGVHHG